MEGLIFGILRYLDDRDHYPPPPLTNYAVTTQHQKTFKKRNGMYPTPPAKSRIHHRYINHLWFGIVVVCNFSYLE